MRLLIDYEMDINYKNILIGIGSGLVAGFIAFRKGLEIGAKLGYNKAMSDYARPNGDRIGAVKTVDYI